VILTRFTDVGRIRALSGQDLVPIIEHDGNVVHDSWAIACRLEGQFPDRPSLFGGAIGRGATRLANIWSDTMLGRTMRQQIYADFIWCIDPDDRPYFRGSREAQLGMTLERYCAIGKGRWQIFCNSARRWSVPCQSSVSSRATPPPMSITSSSRCSSGPVSAAHATCCGHDGDA